MDALNFPGEPYALKARWVFPVDSAPIADGVVSVEAGSIAAIGDDDPSRPILDLGNVAVLPGLVNVHAHLEFSDLQKPLGCAGMAFSDWIREVVAFRRQRSDSADNVERQKREIVKQGAIECLAHGTATLGEITTTPIPDGVLPDAPLRCTMFHELIGLSRERADAALGDAIAWLDKLDRSLTAVPGTDRKGLVGPCGSDRSRVDARGPLDTAVKRRDPGGRAGYPAISPHAPYSVSSELLEQAIALSAKKKIPLAMHLAESAEELELLASHSGPFVEMFSQSGFWEPAAVPRGVRPLDFLMQLERAHRVLVIHGNFLVSDEISFLGERADRMSVVYCPRTHAYFNHGRYPLIEMLAQGVHVALGTDSRASNPNLSLWEELRFVAGRYPEVPLKKVLELGTVCGAAALGLEHEVGTLSPGKRADLCIVGLPDSEAEPHELIFDGSAEVQATVLQGGLVHSIQAS